MQDGKSGHQTCFDQFVELEERCNERHFLLEKLIALNLSLTLVHGDQDPAPRSKDPAKLLEHPTELGASSVDDRVERHQSPEPLVGDGKLPHVPRNRGAKATACESRHLEAQIEAQQRPTTFGHEHSDLTRSAPNLEDGIAH